MQESGRILGKENLKRRGANLVVANVKNDFHVRVSDPFLNPSARTMAEGF